MQSSPSLSNTAETVKFAAWFHWFAVALLATSFAVVLATIYAPGLRLPGNPAAPEVALLLLASGCTIFGMARQLPLENVLLAAALCALIGGAAHLLGAVTGIPFGPFTFTTEIGPRLLGKLPWAVPLLWVVAVFNSRGVARLILRPWRKTKTYGFWLIGLTAALTMLFTLALDPFASRIKHYWFWTPAQFPLTWQDAPLVNFLSWGIVTLLILAFATPALIRKQLSHRSTPDFHPMCVWLGGILVFGSACAQSRLWSAVIADAAIGIVAIIFAIRGARW